MLNVCKCCLEDGNFKNLWIEYEVDDEIEVYGEILNDCFGLAWDKPSESSEAVEQICDFCISRLRHANYFKTLIQISENKLNEYLGKTNPHSKLKNKNKSQKQSTKTVKTIKYVNDDGNIIDDNVMEGGVEVIITDENEVVKIEIAKDDDDEEPYVDDEMDSDYNPAQMNDEDDDDDEMSSEQKAKIVELKRFRSENKPYYRRKDDVDPELLKLAMASLSKPRKKRNPPKRTNKNYSEMSLRFAVHAVLNENVTRSQAARIYGVPRKTISCRIDKILDSSKVMLDYEEMPKFYEHQSKFVDELSTILLNTNATPFKTKHGHYFCAFCSTNSDAIDDPVQLREHTLNDHPKMKRSQIENMLEPTILNEIMRVDIDDFRCTNCDIKLETWNDMIIHMKEIHDFVIDVALKRVIPYVLTENEDISCALCNETCTGITDLDNHMNYHYDSYICSMCGIPLLTYKRFKKHEESHNPAKFSCNECSKIFKSKRSLINHIQVCYDTIIDYNETKLPVEEAEVFCENCGKSFKGATKLDLHIRRIHNQEKNHDCLICEMSFFSKGDLRKHMVTHTKEKRYECSVCERKFGTNSSLRTHYRTHPEVKIGKTDKISKKIILLPA